MRMYEMPRFVLLLWISLSIFAAGCKSSRNFSRAEASARSTLNATLNNNLKYESVAMNGKVEMAASARSMSLSVNYRIYIRHDSLMGVRISKLGIEAARVLITRDSLYLLNRLEKTYSVAGVNASQRFTGFDANFAVLEDLLTGNLNLIPKDIQLPKEKQEEVIITGTEGEMSLRYVLDDRMNKLIRIEASNAARNQLSLIRYQSFESQEGMNYPMEGIIQIVSPEAATFSYKHSKVQFNPKENIFKFEIPSDYVRVAL